MSMQEFDPTLCASYRYRKAVVRGTPFQEVLVATRKPGCSWTDVQGRWPMERIRARLVAADWRVLHRSSYVTGGIKLFTEIWGPVAEYGPPGADCGPATVLPRA